MYARKIRNQSLGHAAAVFKNKLWIVGGTGELYQTYNLRYQNRRADVWSSSDGETWIQSDDLTGDFHLQNFDAVDPGSLAPWYARFGHTLDVLNGTDNSGVSTELMILTGGYTPDPDNDVWVTEDGSESLFKSAAAVLFFAHCSPFRTERTFVGIQVQCSMIA